MDEQEYKECLVCKQTKPITNFQVSASGNRLRACGKCYQDRDSANLKLRMLAALGWKCACCGEDHPQLLTLDHVNNDGASLKKAGESSRGLHVRANEEGWPKDKYQLLCWNCNAAKGRYGICPHQASLTTEQAIQDLQKRVFNLKEVPGSYTREDRIAQLRAARLAYRDRQLEARSLKGMEPPKPRVKVSAEGLIGTLTPEQIEYLLKKFKT